MTADEQEPDYTVMKKNHTSFLNYEFRRISKKNIFFDSHDTFASANSCNCDRHHDNMIYGKMFDIS